MAKVKATKKFKEELGIENNYQGLKTDEYFKLKAGAVLDMDDIPEYLIEKKYLEKIKDKKL